MVIKTPEWIRIGIQPKMLDPDPESMNPDPKDCLWDFGFKPNNVAADQQQKLEIEYIPYMYNTEFISR